MSTLEQGLVARARPYVLAARAREMLEQEAIWGCTPQIAPYPVQLEPPFRDLSMLRHSYLLAETEHTPAWLAAEPLPGGEVERWQVWLPADGGLDWLRAELFLRQLQASRHPLGLEVLGHADGVCLAFLVCQRDAHLLRAAFRGWYPACELTPLPDPPPHTLSWEEGTRLLLRDFYPPPPYSHRFTAPEALRLSPLEAVVAGLMQVPPPSWGLCQVLFQPVSAAHNWHRNVELLLDLEYAVNLLSGAHLAPSASHYPQQSPSGDLHHMAQDTESKAHNDRPFYAVALRTAVVGEDEETATDHLEALSSPLALFQHGGRPLGHLTEADYLQVVSREQMTGMMAQGHTYRPGFLLNSAELSGLVHLPSGEALAERGAPLGFLESLSVQDGRLGGGTPIGLSSRAGVERVVCIPPEVRSRSTHLIARHGMGKSTLLEHMALHDIGQGHGVAVLDPHGDLIQRLLCLIPREHVERVIYFNPGDTEWVPLWNPLHRTPGQEISRTADELVASIKSVVTGWGDRLEHLLRHGFFGLLHLPDATLLDLSDLLTHKSERSQRLRQVIVERVDNQAAYRFWQYEFER